MILKGPLLYFLPDVRELGLECMTEGTLVSVRVVLIATLFAQSMPLMAMTVSRKIRSQTFTEITGHSSQIKFKERVTSGDT